MHLPRGSSLFVSGCPPPSLLRREATLRDSSVVHPKALLQKACKMIPGAYLLHSESGMPSENPRWFPGTFFYLCIYLLCNLLVEERESSVLKNIPRSGFVDCISVMSFDVFHMLSIIKLCSSTGHFKMALGSLPEALLVTVRKPRSQFSSKENKTAKTTIIKAKTGSNSQSV